MKFVEKPDYIETSEQWESKYPRLVFWNKVKQLEKQRKSSAVPLEQFHDHLLSVLEFTMDNIAATLVEIKDAVMRLQKNIDRLMSVASGEEELEIDLSQAAKDIQHFLAVEDYVKVKKNYDNLVSDEGHGNSNKLFYNLHVTENKIIIRSIHPTVHFDDLNLN